MRAWYLQRDDWYWRGLRERPHTHWHPHACTLHLAGCSMMPWNSINHLIPYLLLKNSSPDSPSRSSFFRLLSLLIPLHLSPFCSIRFLFFYFTSTRIPRGIHYTINLAIIGFLLPSSSSSSSSNPRCSCPDFFFFLPFLPFFILFPSFISSCVNTGGKKTIKSRQEEIENRGTIGDRDGISHE